MNTVVLGHLGAARGHEHVVPGEGLKKRLHFCHEFDQMLSRFFDQIVMFFTCLFESLNLPPNQHKMYGTKQFFRKGCMYANRMIYRVERVCATNLRTRAWPQKTRTNRMFFVCDFVVFFGVLWFQFVHQFLIIFLTENGCQNGSRIDAKIIKRRPKLAKRATRMHWDCFVVVCDRRKTRSQKLSKKHRKK